MIKLAFCRELPSSVQPCGKSESLLDNTPGESQMGPSAQLYSNPLDGFSDKLMGLMLIFKITHLFQLAGCEDGSLPDVKPKRSG